MLFKSQKAKWALRAFEASGDLYFAVDERGIVRGSCNLAALKTLQRPDRNVLFPLGSHRTLLGCLHTGQPATIRDRLDGQPAVWECTPIPGTGNVLVRCSARLGELEHAVMTDPLTGLANKRQWLADLLEYRASSGLAARLLADVDHFGRFNKTYGHPAGDDLLIAVGGVFARHLRPKDKACRFGGEEFSFEMLGLIDNHEFTQAVVRSRSEAIREDVAKIKLGSIDHEPVTVSIGVVIYPSGAEDREIFAKQADDALCYAKETGRNRVVFYEDVPTDWLQQRSTLTQPEPAHAVSTTSSAL